MGVQYLMFYPGKQASKHIVRGLEWEVRVSEAKTEEQGRAGTVVRRLF